MGKEGLKFLSFPEFTCFFIDRAGLGAWGFQK